MTADKSKIKTALIVDDDEDVLLIMETMLSDLGVSVITFSKSENAEEGYRNRVNAGFSVDLIAVDIRMPIIDGYKLAKKFRDVGYQGTIVALTSNATGTGRQTSRESGIDFYFGKPQLTKKLFATLLNIPSPE